jgi:hypothetical protein
MVAVDSLRRPSNFSQLWNGLWLHQTDMKIMPNLFVAPLMEI